ncbi:GNAT family N-acetyltransferase [Microbacterium sp. ASV49]|uniref:GNAT family N-acetyltransferase n=1 Tax=Microbacterium candidum TaxID=3041922 RepID=A0ABT7N2Z3_9MICO|nr:GNAT family N-acetyltransferase [Microbacterium sp. ASV49]MDL9981079.1 GNAT family N-acetyltransferase [Microbacterium sp. ASV49]
MKPAIEIRVDDLSSEDVRALIAAHLEGMHASSPACSVHALDVDALRAPGVTVWSAWIDEDLAGVGALKEIDPERGELKSMRVAGGHLGQGVGRAVLRHIMTDAATRGVRSLWLETGTTPDFDAARGLYASEGFVYCEPFDGYVEDPFSVFMTRSL